jgi:hypothetical protein
MADAHGLRPKCWHGVTLREFCGQREAPYDVPAWMDHSRCWIDDRGEPVLSAEPYGFEPMDVVRDLTGLPLTVERHEGVWNDSTDLFLLRRDPTAEPLPEVYEPPPPDDHVLFALTSVVTVALLIAERIAYRRHRANFRPPTQQSIGGLLARVLADRGGSTLDWAARRLALHVLAGHLAVEEAHRLIAGVLAGLGDDATDADTVLADAWTPAYYEVLAGGGETVREVLDDEWHRDALNVLADQPGAASFPNLVRAWEWLDGVMIAEAHE